MAPPPSLPVGAPSRDGEGGAFGAPPGEPAPNVEEVGTPPAAKPTMGGAAAALATPNPNPNPLLRFPPASADPGETDLPPNRGCGPNSPRVSLRGRGLSELGRLELNEW